MRKLLQPAMIVADNAEELIGVALIIGIGGIMGTQVFLRTVFNAPMSWPEELSQFLMVWAALFGGIGALKRSELVRIEVFGPRLPASVATLMPWVQLALSLLLLATVILGGHELAGRSRMQAASMPFSWYWAYIAAPVFAVIAAGRLVQKSLGYRFRFIGATADQAPSAGSAR